ncbi:hypothetical protein RRG48_04165 [Mycoplasmopsis canis]|uniref:LppA-related lipoprotein n=1 Tax=Mycoplasmopsis cynos TaxID=171284 RepID=UPI002B001833|nr:hypothetical protein [Mycoplasmopsis cynos]WQQ13266.1 lipoprotein 17-related variable surface protein [Mycoplasmopsis cynos]WQQ13843.1 lipoprotein 17-related variable surface protein [Mycoplasmopsis cynos]
MKQKMIKASIFSALNFSPIVALSSCNYTSQTKAPEDEIRNSKNPNTSNTLNKKEDNENLNNNPPKSDPTNPESPKTNSKKDDTTTQTPNQNNHSSDSSKNPQKNQKNESMSNDNSNNTIDQTEGIIPEQDDIFDFSDLNNFKLEYNINSLPYYKGTDAISARERLKPDEIKILIGYYSSISQDIKNKYDITIDLDKIQEDNLNGILRNIKIKFQAKNNTKHFTIKTIILKGFKVNQKNEKNNPKDTFLSPKSISGPLSKTFASLVGAMLMYNANINTFSQLQNKEYGAINYETIEDFQKNSNYFKDQSIRLNQALKNSFFDTINKDNNPEFDYKILQVKPDDVNGTLGVQVEIFDLEGSQHKSNRIQKEYTFNGFKKLTDQKVKDFINFTITPESLKDVIIKKKLYSQKFKDLYNENKNKEERVELNNLFDQSLLDHLKKLIFKKIMISFINDDLYNLTEQITLDKIIATKTKYSIYPFVMNFSDNIIKDFKVYFEYDSSRKEQLVKFDFKFGLIPFLTNSFTNMQEFYNSNSSEIELNKTYWFSASKLNE